MSSKATAANNLFASISLLLFIGTVVFLSVKMGRIDRLEDNLMKEKVISEALLSEKLLVEKERDKGRLTIKHTQGVLAKVQDQADSLSGIVKIKDGQISSLKNTLKQITNDRKIHTAIEQKNVALETELSRRENAHSEMERVRLLQDEKISALLEENQALAKTIQSLTPSIRGVFIETKKRNARLTVAARKTRKITCSIGVTETESIACEIIDPAGNLVKTTEETLSLTFEPTENNIRVTFAPEHKLLAGRYTIRLLSKDRLTGSLQVQLR
jgi:hypothetical protein